MRAEDRLKAEAKTLRNPSLQRAALGAVNPDETQFLADAAASSEQLPCPVAVRQVSSGDQDGYYESHRIDEKMPFPSCDAFATIVASHTCRCMVGLACLTIDTASRWMLVPPDSLTKPHSERVMQPSPGAIVPPLPEVGVDALPRRKVARQHPPLNATHSQVENGINHQTHVQAAGASARFGCGNQMLDNKPLAVSQICWVSFCFHKNYVYHNLADSLYFSNSLLQDHGMREVVAANLTGFRSLRHILGVLCPAASLNQHKFRWISEIAKNSPPLLSASFALSLIFNHIPTVYAQSVVSWKQNEQLQIPCILSAFLMSQEV